MAACALSLKLAAGFRIHPMTHGPAGFVQRTQRLKDDLVAQGRRVQAVVEAAFDSIFTASAERASWVKAQDDLIDSVDVALEQASVQLLADATRRDGPDSGNLTAEQLRAVLTIVKINNEFERTADVAVDLAEMVLASKIGAAHPFPATFRVMANSVVGIVRDVNTAIMRDDPSLANIVLQSQHAVTAFKDALLRDSEDKLIRGEMNADFAFAIHEVGTACEIIADHCTNMAEQVIYLKTGAIVRHGLNAWERIDQKQHD
jgi:phosphate transport system protein